MAIVHPWMIAVVIVALIAMIAVWLIVRKNTTKKIDKTIKILANTKRIEELPEYKKAHLQYKLMLCAVIILAFPILITTTLLSARFSSTAVETPVANNRDIMLCLDVSGSMYDSDARVLDKFIDVAAGLTTERVGLTFFDGSAVMVFPLTDDYDFIQEQLAYAVEAFETNPYMGGMFHFIADGVSIGGGSSNIGDGLASCVLNFDRMGEERSRSIILSTDNAAGSNSLVDLMQAAQMARTHDIRVYGLNSPDRDYEVAGGQTAEDEAEEYRQAVTSTGGAYYKFEDKEVVSELVDQIMKQEAARIEGAPMLVKKDQPLVLFIIAMTCTVGLLALLWRLKL